MILILRMYMCMYVCIYKLLLGVEKRNLLPSQYKHIRTVLVSKRFKWTATDRKLQ